MRENIVKVFEEVGDHYKKLGLAESEIHDLHDVHAFYKLAKYNGSPKAVHVQGYAVLSTEREMKVHVRLMDYDAMMELRKKRIATVGNEHAAAIWTPSEFRSIVGLPYDSNVLIEKLDKHFSQLR